MKIAFLGDIHFRSDKDYFRKTCEEFLSWFRDWSYNTSENILVLCGDIVEVAVNGGLVIEYLKRFKDYSNFKEIHICVGNHDLKKIQGIEQLAYEFYRKYDNVFIYDKITETTIGGKKALIMPYFVGYNEYDKEMYEYYSTISENENFSNDYDFIVGHFDCDDVTYGGKNCVTNLDTISGRPIIGHVHTRYTNPNRYIGSVFAGKKNENDSSRCALFLDEDGTWSEESLPIFNEFLQITYPMPLKKTKALVPIYTVLCCSDEKLARDTYGDIFIRSVTPEDNDDPVSKVKNLNISSTFLENLSITDMFEEFIKSRQKPISEGIENYSRKILCS